MLNSWKTATIFNDIEKLVLLEEKSDEIITTKSKVGGA